MAMQDIDLNIVPEDDRRFVYPEYQGRAATPMPEATHGAAVPMPNPAPPIPMHDPSMAQPVTYGDLETMGGGLPPEDIQRADAMYADMGFPAPRQVDPADQLLQGAAAHHQQAEELRALANQQVQWSAPNPVHPATQRYTGAMLGDEGLLSQQEIAEAQQRQAAQREAAVAAEAFEHKAAMLRDRAIDQKAQQFEQQRQMEEARQNQQAALKAFEDAGRQVREAQAYDPDLWWENKSTGGKITSVIALILGGIGFGGAGRPELAMQLRQQIIQPELEKQKEVYARLQDQQGAAGEMFKAQGNLYAQTMAQVQDERQADLIVESSLLEATLAEGEAMMAQAGVHTLTAENQATMNQLRQQLAQNRMQLEILSATTPKRVGGSSYALDPSQRSALTREADRQDKRAEKFEDIEMGVYKDRSIDAQKEARAAALKKGEGPSESDARRFAQRQYIQKETMELREEVAQIEKFKQDYEEKGEIPGLAWGMGWMPEGIMSNEQLKARNRLKRIVMLRLRKESGAAISNEELERDASALLNARSEREVFNDLDARLGEARRKIDIIERAPDEAAVEEFTRSQAAPRAAIESGGVGLQDPVRWDQ